MNDEQAKQYFSQNINAPTPAQGQSDNDTRIKLEVAKEQAAKEASSTSKK